MCVALVASVTILGGCSDSEPESGRSSGGTSGAAALRPIGAAAEPSSLRFRLVDEAAASALALSDYYRDDPHVEVIVDRRAQGGAPGDTPAFEDRRRRRVLGTFPTIEPPATA